MLRLKGEDYDATGPDDDDHRARVEPWLSAVLQSEHLSLLVGNGLTAAIAAEAGVDAPRMDHNPFKGDFAGEIDAAATNAANAVGRDAPNFEDRLGAALTLEKALGILNDDRLAALKKEISESLRELVGSVLDCERGIRDELAAGTEKGIEARRLLMSFLLTFASRASSRERLHLFSTNYDRVVELGCDDAGLRPLDRFVGALEPVFRSSRLDVDMHYNPPGIRGEPRYLEGVIRFTKVHGSLDWRFDGDRLRRVGLPFGAETDHPESLPDPAEGLMIYPNSAKDVETLLYPYAELMRDMSAALCRPNSVLATYGYGFGDDHINRVILDMLSIPSTHLVAMSFDWCNGRLQSFLDQLSRPSQVTLLVGEDLAGLSTLVERYLPKPAIDTISIREAELKKRRASASAADEGGG